MAVNTQQHESFQHDGYLVARNLLTGDELAELDRMANRLLDRELAPETHPRTVNFRLSTMGLQNMSQSQKNTEVENMPGLVSSTVRPWLSFQAVIASCMLSALLLQKAPAEMWSDSTGKFSVDAEFVEIAGDNVILKKSTGVTITVPTSRLSEASLALAKQLQRASLNPATGLLNAAAAADKAKKKTTIPGTYVGQLHVGQVHGDQAKTILKADGSIVVHPTQEDPDFKLSGKWKYDGKLITAKLIDPEGKEGTMMFKPAGGSLTVLKIVKPNGEVEEFKSPQFAKKKALADKGPAGVYEGNFDGEQLLVEMAPKGGFFIRSAEDPDEGEIYTGKWKLTDKGLSATITDEDEGETIVRMRITDAGFALVGTVNAEGEGKYFEARLKRVKLSRKKDGRKPK